MYPSMEGQIRDLLHTLREEFRAARPGKIVRRRIHPPDLASKIDALIGMRRTGKTWLLFQIAADLEAAGVPADAVLYVNWEDDRLLPAGARDLAGLVGAFYSEHPENHDRTCHLLLDEIQNVSGWSRVARRLLDTRRVRIHVTGSSARLLGREIATELRGRSLPTEIWPYDFREWLEAIGSPPSGPPRGQRSRDRMIGALARYIEEGGFPETAGIDPVNRRRILLDYVQVVLFRDIVERHEVKNTTLIRYLIRTLLRSPGRAFSIHRFLSDLRSQGIRASKTALHEYLGHVEDAYLAFAVPLYSESIRRTQSNPRKVYSVDTGLSRAVNPGAGRDMGHLFENLVYLDLRRRGCEVFYYLTGDRKECDFVARFPDGETRLYQACWDPSDEETLGRESRALEAAMREIGVGGEIVTPGTYLDGIIDERTGVAGRGSA